ncbi:MAG: hypothetical protein ACSLFM_06055 [Tepidiformaceae bacterium]
MATPTNDQTTNTAPKRFPSRTTPLAAPLTLVVDAGETCVGDECALPGAAGVPVSPKPADD